MFWEKNVQEGPGVQGTVVCGTVPGVFVSMREHARHSSLSVVCLLPRGFQRLMQEDEDSEAILGYVVRLPQTIYVNCTVLVWFNCTHIQLRTL